jgi:hypothetical protein
MLYKLEEYRDHCFAGVTILFFLNTKNHNPLVNHQVPNFVFPYRSSYSGSSSAVDILSSLKTAEMG